MRVKNIWLPITFLAGTLIAFSGCSSVVETKNEVPLILGGLTDISVPRNDTIELDVSQVLAVDKNGDAMEIVILDSANYSVVPGTSKVVPDSGVVGDIYLYLQAKDSEGNLSEVFQMILSVLPVDRQQIQPVYPGALWAYLDTFYTLNEVDTTTLEVPGSYTGTIPGVAGTAFRMRWSGLAGYLTESDSSGSDTVEYLMLDSSIGTVMAGGTSFYDLDNQAPHLFVKYPVTKGESWPYASLEYNLELKQFFRDTTIDSMRCIDTAVYIEVPAGTFKCIQYQYVYKQFLKSRGMTPTVRLQNREILITTTKARADTTVDVMVNLYYALGVGYVKNETFVGGTKVYSKVLNTYTVDEK